MGGSPVLAGEPPALFLGLLSCGCLARGAVRLHAPGAHEPLVLWLPSSLLDSEIPFEPPQTEQSRLEESIRRMGEAFCTRKQHGGAPPCAVCAEEIEAEVAEVYRDRRGVAPRR